MSFQAMVTAAEHLHGEGFWDEYASILLDPAHVAAELTFTILDVLVLSPFFLVMWTLIRRWMTRTLDREHHRLDLEHGLEDHSGNSCPNCGSDRKLP